MKEKNPLLFSALVGGSIGYLIYSGGLYWLVDILPTIPTFLSFELFMFILFGIVFWARKQKRKDDTTPKTSTSVITFLLLMSTTIAFVNLEVWRYESHKVAIAPITSTADWKTYTNPDYGFELKYPEDLEFTPPFDNKTPVYSSFSFDIKDKKDYTVFDLSFAVATKGYPGTLADDRSILFVSRGFIMIDGVQATRDVRQYIEGNEVGKKSISYYFTKGDNIYVIYANGSFYEKADQILATFKFTK